VCGSVRFRPEQICAVTDSVSEQQRSVRSISRKFLEPPLTTDPVMYDICTVDGEIKYKNILG